MAEAEWKVTAAYVRSVGQLFQSWATDIDKIYTKLTFARITPGSTADAATLSEEYGKRLEKWTTDINTMRGMFADSGAKLIALANKYENLEDLNKANADKVSEVIDAVMVYYPDAANVISKAPEIPQKEYSHHTESPKKG